ncbi:MAG: response regulator, partial [Desulfobacterales bacterium]
MRQTILLVDDEPDIRDVLSLSLYDMGYHVYEAENGDEALRIFKDKQPSMVMTDIKMPGMDGIELLKKIKHENPETEVIMITGHGDMDLAIRSLKCEATDFITKPINVDALELALQRVRERIFTRQK